MTAAEPAEPGRLLLSPVQAATRLGIGRSTLYLLLADEQLESVHIGARRLVPVEGLERYVEGLRRGDAGADPPDDTLGRVRCRAEAQPAAPGRALAADAASLDLQVSEQKVGDGMAAAAAGANGRCLGSSGRFEGLLGDPERSVLGVLVACIESRLFCLTRGWVEGPSLGLGGWVASVSG